MRASVGWAAELVMGSAQEEESEPAGKRGNYPKKKGKRGNKMVYFVYKIPSKDFFIKLGFTLFKY